MTLIIAHAEPAESRTGGAQAAVVTRHAGRRRAESVEGDPPLGKYSVTHRSSGCITCAEMKNPSLEIRLGLAG